MTPYLDLFPSSWLQNVLIKKVNIEVVGPKTEEKNGNITKMGMKFKREKKKEYYPKTAQVPQI